MRRLPVLVTAISCGKSSAALKGIKYAESEPEQEPKSEQESAEQSESEQKSEQRSKPEQSEEAEAEQAGHL